MRTLHDSPRVILQGDVDFISPAISIQNLDHQIILRPNLGPIDLRDPTLSIKIDIEVTDEFGVWGYAVGCTWILGQIDAIDPAPSLTFSRILSRTYVPQTRSTKFRDLDGRQARLRVRPNKPVRVGLIVESIEAPETLITEPLKPPASISVAQSVAMVVAVSSATVAASFASTPTANNLIVAGSGMRFSGVGPPAITVTDNQSNSYVQNITGTQSRMRSCIDTATAVTSSGTFTVTATSASGTPTGMIISLLEVAGFATVGTVEATNSGAGNSTDPQTGTVTPAANALYVALTCGQGATTVVQDMSPTWSATEISSGGGAITSELNQIVSSGALQGDWTFGVTINWAAVIVAIKEDVGGATDDKDNPNEWQQENKLIEDVDENSDNVDSPWDEMGALDTPTISEFQISNEDSEVIDEQFDNIEHSGWSWDNPAIVVDSDVLDQQIDWIEELTSPFDNVEYSGWSWENPAPVVDTDTLLQTPDYLEDAEDVNQVYYPAESELYTDLPELLESFRELFVKNIPIDLGQIGNENHYIGTWGTTGTGAALVADQIFYIPIRIPYNTIISEIGVNVTVASLTPLARLGLYFNDRGIPSRLIYQNVLNFKAIGFRPILCNIHIEAGTYWLAFLQNSNAAQHALINVVDQSLLAVDNPGVFNLNYAHKQAYSYAALPNTATPEGYINYASGVPHMRVRIK